MTPPSSMTPGELRARLEPLLGPAWQVRIARGMRRNVRGIRRQIERGAIAGDVAAVVELLERLAARLGTDETLESALPPHWHAAAIGRPRRQEGCDACGSLDARRHRPDCPLPRRHP